MNPCRTPGLRPHPDAAMVRRRRRCAVAWDQAAERTPVADIFDEVAEDLRAERAERLLRKYAWLIGVLVIASVGGAIGWELWNRHLAEQDAAAAARYITASTDLEQAPAGNHAAALATLDQLAATAPQGYRTLARMRAAAVKASEGDIKGAAALWDQVAADPNADPLLRDSANILAIEHQLDNGDPALLAGRLEPMTSPDNPFAPLANEQLALLDLRQGKTDAARTKLKALSSNVLAPSGVRARAAALLAGIGSAS
jgi:hypothetical protein